MFFIELPNEIIIYILHFLNVNILGFNISLVNKSLNKITYSHPFWKYALKVAKHYNFYSINTNTPIYISSEELEIIKQINNKNYNTNLIIENFNYNLSNFKQYIYNRLIIIWENKIIEIK